jgi:hypothetical protein
VTLQPGYGGSFSKELGDDGVVGGCESRLRRSCALLNPKQRDFIVPASGTCR